MTKRVCAILFGFIGLLCATSAAAPRFLISLDLRPGERFVEHRYVSERTQWKLPRKRLERFVRGGVIVNEERHITSIVSARVTRVHNGVATLSGQIDLTDSDVARHQERRLRQSFTGLLTSKNEAVSGDKPDIEDAVMAGLPTQPLGVGQCWTTHQAVQTSLGSGSVSIRHCLAARDGALLRFAVSGTGTITGKEYRLPKLLPGSIDLSGAAWYDLQQRFVTQESYRIHNRLLKPAEGESVGFDEILDVDISARSYQSGRSQPSMAGPAYAAAKFRNQIAPCSWASLPRSTT